MWYCISCYWMSLCFHYSKPYLVLPLSLQLIKCWHILHETAASLWTMQLDALILQSESLLLLSPTEAPTYICHQSKSQGRCPKTVRQTNLEGTGKKAKVDTLSMCTVRWLRATEELFHKNKSRSVVSSGHLSQEHVHMYVFPLLISYKLPWIVQANIQGPILGANLIRIIVFLDVTSTNRLPFTSYMV